ncbi:GNAT family N-acetyltransferase [Bacillus alkalisoli]|uniref:GNAT family N-acetyltransferase n=1 Tax=Bacillus alkalisoli TaxID=2011008 RepID=UPI0012FF0A47|nr:GNAT family N-acetyltransferase [Bacillus alkalisoli]
MSVRRYKQGDAPKIRNLFKKVFQKEYTEKMWKWKFECNFDEKQEPWVLVYEEGNAILGHISLWVNDAYVYGEKKKIGLRIDTMVDPDSRGKGIYEKLNEYLLKEAKKDNIEFLYGFPAPKAKELFIKHTGAEHMIDMPRYISILRPFILMSSKLPILSVGKKLDDIIFRRRKKKLENKDSSNYEIKEVNRCSQEFDELAENTKDMYKAWLVRDSNYLNWRYIQHPEKDYKLFGCYEQEKLVGYIVIGKSSNVAKNITTGIILDFLFIEKDGISELLLNKAMEYLIDVSVIQTWALPNSSVIATLEKGGFILKDSPMPLVGIEVNPQLSELRKHEKWCITPGDVDSF